MTIAVYESARDQTRRLASLLALVAAVSCAASPDAVQSEAGGRPVAPVADPSVLIPAYTAPEPGRWRLARTEQLGAVVFWLSHVLVRYSDASASVSFQLSGWQPAGPAPTRSHAEALQLAENIRERAVRDPQRFSALARELSEDPTTRDVGGDLGGVRADQVPYLPQLLDALQASKPGEILPVIESQWGFHVVNWKPAPAPRIVSGSRIIIGHDEAPWLGDSLMARAAMPKRSRAEALALAKQVFAEATQAPDHFTELARKYSEHADAVRGGDFGTWSTREVTEFPREVAALERLAPGEVAPPIESAFGFEIIRRTENRARPTYQMQAIRLMFDTEAPEGGPESESSIRERTLGMYAELERDPAGFDTLRAEHCCVRGSVVIDGRYPERLVALLAGLKVGQIAPQPLKFGRAYMIYKLVARGWHEATPNVELTLPAPREVDLAYWVPQLDPARLGSRLRALGAQPQDFASLIEGKADEYRRAHEHASELSSLAPQQRVERVEQLESQAKELLEAEEQTRYHDVLQRQLAEVVLGR